MNLLEQIQVKEARMNAITAEIETADSVDKVKELNVEYEKLNEERSTLKTALNAKPVVVTQVGDLTLRGAAGQGELGVEDPRATVEYRKSFMNYVRSRSKDVPVELRADATTMTSDITALIPTTIMNRVIEELDSYGNVFQRITRSNVPGGVDIPISSLKPEATWVAEGSVSEKKKLTVTSKVSFSYYKLQVRIATSLEASATSLDQFEKLVARAITRAIVKAIEASVFNGTGVGQPLGLLVDPRIVAGQKLAFAAADVTFSGWMTKFISKIKNAYAALPGNAIYVNKATWDTYMAGMVGTDGHPVARVNMGIGGKQERSFLGYPVEIVDYYGYWWKTRKIILRLSC